MGFSCLWWVPTGMSNPILFILLLRTVPRGESPYKNTGPQPSRWRKEISSLQEQISVATPSLAQCVRRIQVSCRRIGLSLASHPSPCLSPLHPGWELCHPPSHGPRHPPGRAALFRETWKPFGKRKRKPLFPCCWSHITFSF